MAACSVVHTRFLYALWMASRASLMVTPLRLRADTSSPSGKWRSIFLTGGVVKCSFSMLGSSTVLELLLIFLGDCQRRQRRASWGMTHTIQSFASLSQA